MTRVPKDIQFVGIHFYDYSRLSTTRRYSQFEDCDVEQTVKYS